MVMSTTLSTSDPIEDTTTDVEPTGEVPSTGMYTETISTSATTADTGTSITATETTGGVCGAGTILCEGMLSKTCDGMGGFSDAEVCEDDCLDDAGCVTCEDNFVEPACEEGYPRIMILLDASSSTLNLESGLIRAPKGQGHWEELREILAGTNSFFDILVDVETKLQERAYVGLTAFGHNMPDQSTVLIQYGACHEANTRWALDPINSCGNGCSDPYADAPITWTFQDGAILFGEPTISHMPNCQQGQFPNKGCFGSGTYTHLGLNRIQNNLAVYKADCAMGLAEPCSPTTQYINILITDGLTNSTQMQYSAPLMQMASEGVFTFVIGYGPFVDSQQTVNILNEMAHLGSLNMHDYFDANNPGELKSALIAITDLLDDC